MIYIKSQAEVEFHKTLQSEHFNLHTSRPFFYYYHYCYPSD